MSQIYSGFSDSDLMNHLRMVCAELDEIEKRKNQLLELHSTIVDIVRARETARRLSRESPVLGPTAVPALERFVPMETSNFGSLGRDAAPVAPIQSSSSGAMRQRVVLPPIASEDPTTPFKTWLATRHSQAQPPVPAPRSVFENALLGDTRGLLHAGGHQIARDRSYSNIEVGPSLAESTHLDVHIQCSNSLGSGRAQSNRVAEFMFNPDCDETVLAGNF